MTTQSKRLLLIGLLIAWAGAVAWTVWGYMNPDRAPLAFKSGQAMKREEGRSRVGSGLKVQLDVLASQRQQANKSFSTPKNIFAPLGTDTTVQVESPPPVLPNQTPPEPIPEVSPDVLARQAAQQDLAQFRYLGYLTRNGKDQAFLAKGKEIHIVRVGETINQHIMVTAIAPTGVTLQDQSSHTEHVVTLSTSSTSSRHSASTPSESYPPSPSMPQDMPPDMPPDMIPEPDLPSQ